MIKKITNKWKNIPLTLKVTVAYAVCSILQKCLSFITLPLFTRILTKEQYGQYTIYSSWSGIFSILLTLNLAYGSFSTAMVKFEKKRDEYISSMQGICLLLSGVFLLIYLPFREFFNKWLELPTFLVILLVVELLCTTAFLFWSGKKRFEFKYRSVVLLTLLNSFVSPIVAVCFVTISKEKGYARIFGYAITTIVISGCIFVLNCLRGKKLFIREFWKYALGFNIPLVAYYFSQVIFNQSDRIMISHMCGIDKAAMYGVAYNLATILTFVLNAINNTYVPWLYNKIKENKTSDNRNVASGIALLMAVLLVGVIWFAPEIIRIMAGKGYGEAKWVVAPVAMSLLLLFYSQLFINVEFYYEEKKSLVYASIGSMIVNVVLNYLLIPRFGFVVAGYTTWISYILFAFSNYIAMKKIFIKKGIQNDLYNYKTLITIIILFSLLGFLGVSIYDYLIIRIAIVCVGIVVLILNTKKIMGIVSSFRKTNYEKQD